MEYDNYCVAGEKARKAALANEYGSLYKSAHEKRESEKVKQAQNRKGVPTIYGRLGEQALEAEY